MMEKSLDLSLFDYAFPKELVAQHPLPRRDESRLMVVDRRKIFWEHRQFPDLLEYLRPGDLLIFNDTLADLVPMEDRLVPALPPYIRRKKAVDFTPEDFERYRTVYGRTPGSKAAPTAGFHFSEDLLEKIKSLGVELAFVTLQVSYDTFKPIRSQNILEHPMHGEEYVVPEETAAKVLQAKKEGHRVIAVGTTTVRALESWALLTPAPGTSLRSVRAGGSENESEGRIERPGASSEGSVPGAGVTSLFITPGFQFKIVDAMVTNFHRPRSTVLVMVSAFAGRDFILSAYQEAIRERYRLFSYGDAMLIF